MSVASGTYREASGTHGRPVRQGRAHPVMCNYPSRRRRKRMIVLLREEDFDAWLDAPPERSMEFMRACPPEDLVATGEPRP